MNPVETVEHLARSKHRVTILEALAEHGSIENHVLRDRLDVSRTTVGRNLAALEEQGWVRRTNADCAITRRGELVLEEFSDLLDTIDFTDRLRSFLRWIPEDAFDLDLETLTGATIVLARPGDPHAMLNHHARALDGMERYRVVLPFTGLLTAGAVDEQLDRPGVGVEAVVSPAVRDLYFSTPGYQELFEHYVESGRFEASVTERPLPYCIAIIDETVHIVVTQEGDPRALLESSDDRVREWAIERFESFRRESIAVAAP